MHIDKIVLWGHKLHSHTHSYIHWGFFRGAQHLGYKTYWLDNSDDISNLDLSNAMFITEGQVDQKIPIRNDCKYILHNCDGAKYKSIIHNCKNLQVYTDSILQYNFKKISTCFYYTDDCIVFPWATDLLPHEIIKPDRAFNSDSKIVNWVGTIGGSEFGNINEITPFKDKCNQNGIEFKQFGSISMDDNISKIRESYLAPAIVGTWQQKWGYIPCRIFKNISYGQFGLTNSPRVAELFDNKIVFNSDSSALFDDAKKTCESLRLEQFHELMDIVKEKHTYINRIKQLIDFVS